MPLRQDGSGGHQIGTATYLDTAGADRPITETELPITELPSTELHGARSTREAIG